MALYNLSEILTANAIYNIFKTNFSKTVIRLWLYIVNRAILTTSVLISIRHTDCWVYFKRQVPIVRIPKKGISFIMSYDEQIHEAGGQKSAYFCPHFTMMKLTGEEVGVTSEYAFFKRKTFTTHHILDLIQNSIKDLPCLLKSCMFTITVFWICFQHNNRQYFISFFQYLNFRENPSDPVQIELQARKFPHQFGK